MTVTRRLLLISVALSAACCLWVGAALAQAGPRVRNLRSGDTLRYPLALLIGEADATDGEPLTVVRRADGHEPRNLTTQVLGKRFKALVELVPGANHLTLSAAGQSTELDLRYEPQTNPYYVRLIYYTDESRNTDYQTEIEGDPQDYAAKLDTAAKLMQTFTAETLNDQGYGRKTFSLELDEQQRVKMHVVRGEHPVEHYRATGADALYPEIHEHLNRTMPDPFAKNVVLMAFTRWDPEQKRGLAHAALGGGDMALFGTPDLFTWPSLIEQVQAAFTDERRVDPTRSFDDSAGRSAYWSQVATQLGATLHETGHCFSLPHSPDPFCIMSRGFDHLNRMFTLVEPPHAHRAEAYAFPDKEIAHFSVAARLAYNRWFQLDRREYQDAPAAEVQTDFAAGTIVLTSQHGMRVVGINGGDVSREDDVFKDDPPKRLGYRIADLSRRGGGKGVSLVVIDAEGNETHIGAEQLTDPQQFVRAWRFAAEAVDWPSKDRFVEVSPERIAELTNQLSAREPDTSPGAFIDLIPRYPGGTDNRATYALCTLRCDGERKATLYTGSDDALRVWLNGRLVVEKLVLRPAGPDQDSTPITLKAGDNQLLVEVSNGGGGWGFYVRLEGEDGTPLFGGVGMAETVLAVDQTRFTLNVEPTFLYGISYYGALGASDETIRADLDDMQRHGLNWVRVWATWSAFDNDVSAVDADGNARPEFLARLKALVADCNARGMVVDVTLSRGDGAAGPPRLGTHEAHARAVETIVTELKPLRNWYVDLSNERNIRDPRYTSFEELRDLRERVRRLDPDRLVTASQGGDIDAEELRRYVQEVGVDFITPHRPRDSESPSQTEAKTREYLSRMAALGRVVPVHYQEPFRRDYGAWHPTAQDFLTDYRGALAGGAAGWCLHNGSSRSADDGRPRRSFDLRDGRLFDQLDGQEREAITLIDKP